MISFKLFRKEKTTVTVTLPNGEEKIFQNAGYRHLGKKEDNLGIRVFSVVKGVIVQDIASFSNHAWVTVKRT